MLLYFSDLIFQIFQWRGKEASTSRYDHDDAAAVVGLVFNLHLITFMVTVTEYLTEMYTEVKYKLY